MKKLAVLFTVFLIAIIIYRIAPPVRDAIYCDAFGIQVSAPVVVYSTEWCAYCKEARAYLQERKVPHCELDIESSEENYMKFREYGGTGVPLIVVGDKTVLMGFDVNELEQALSKNAVEF